MINFHPNHECLKMFMLLKPSFDGKFEILFLIFFSLQMLATINSSRMIYEIKMLS